MFKQYRKIEPGEFILVGGDCSQGGEDSNVSQFLSKTRLDVPLVYAKQGVAAQMTADIFSVLERIYDVTGLKPVVGFERQNGGASEMERLRVLNRNNKYTLFVMPVEGKREEQEEGTSLGYNTSSLTRPTLVGDLKNLLDVHGITIYDEQTIKELFWFIVNKTGKPEAMKGKHDDHVMALGIVWQIYQHARQPVNEQVARRIMAEFPKAKVTNKYGLY